MAKKSREEEEALKRAEVILKVRSGIMNATEAAKELGISRKTYYKWEKRALTAMMGALSDRRCGRPSQPVDGEKETMRKDIEGMKQQLLLSEQRMHIQGILREDLEIIEKLRAQGVIKKKRGTEDGGKRSQKD